MRHPEDYVEQVLALVESIPAGRATTYGALADAVGRFGPRRIGAVMAEHGAGVPWWRVVRADGSLPEPLRARAAEERRVEGTPVRASGSVDLLAAFWQPPLLDSQRRGRADEATA